MSIRCLIDEPADIELGTGLVREYVIATALETGHDVDLILTLIPELHDFAGHYLRRGAFLVATSGDRLPGPERTRASDGVHGGVGVTPGLGGICEMNRLWIRPDSRRRGLARTLCEAALDAAAALGFRRMTLDVVPTRTEAIGLYRSLGFVAAEPAHEYPFAMVPLGRDL